MVTADTVDEYKASKHKIKELVESVTVFYNGSANNFLDPHIVLVFVANNAAAAAGKKVFEKVRSDFGRVARVKVCMLQVGEKGGDEEVEELWVGVINAVKVTIAASFQERCFLYDEHLRLLSSQRNSPIWDYAYFFVTKESFALTLLQLKQFVRFSWFCVWLVFKIVKKKKKEKCTCGL
jgi:hypothetical protein